MEHNMEHYVFCPFCGHKIDESDSTFSRKSNDDYAIRYKSASDYPSRMMLKYHFEASPKCFMENIIGEEIPDDLEMEGWIPVVDQNDLIINFVSNNLSRLFIKTNEYNVDDIVIVKPMSYSEENEVLFAIVD